MHRVWDSEKGVDPPLPLTYPDFGGCDPWDISRRSRSEMCLTCRASLCLKVIQNSSPEISLGVASISSVLYMGDFPTLLVVVVVVVVLELYLEDGEA